MKWTDTFVIARQLAEMFPEVDPAAIAHADLKSWVLKLSGFADLPERYTGYGLDKIQHAWIAESGSWHMDA